MKIVPDLSSVENAWEFLNTLTYQGRSVDWVQFSNQEPIYFQNLTDSEVIEVAKRIYFNLFIEEPQPIHH